MQKTNIVIKIIAMLSIILFVFYSNIYAGTIDTDIELGTTSAIHSSDGMITRLAGIFQVVGSVISVVALIVIGIRYMLSSLDEKAQMKGILGYYIVGAILVFATSNVLGIVFKVIDGIK